MKIYALLFLLFSFQYTNAQVIKKSINQQQKVTDSKLKILQTYLKKSDNFSVTNLDSSLLYAQKAFSISKNLQDDSIKASVYNTLANSYEYKGLVDSSLKYHQASLTLRIKLKDSIGIGDSYNNLGVSNDQLGKFDVALTNYFKALKIYEKNQLPAKIAMTLANIGIIYKQQLDYKKALDYYLKANELYFVLDDDFGKTVTAGNIGSVLINLKKYHESIRYSNDAKVGYTELKYNRYVPYSITNLAIAYDSLKLYSDAENYYTEAIKLHKSYGNNYEIATAANAFAKCLNKQKKYKESIKISNEVLTYINLTDAGKLKIDYLFNLSKSYAGLGNYLKAYRYTNEFIIAKEALFEKEKIKSALELEKKYETEKKENLLTNERIIVAARELKLKQKTTQFYILLFGTIGFIIIFYLIYKQQKLKNTQLTRENLLKESLQKIETQTVLQEQRLQISRDLHDNIGAQLTFVISSIENVLYYFKIEDRNLKSKLVEISNFTRSTIIELRDTIWAINKNKITIEDLEIRIRNFIEKAQLVSNHTQFKLTLHPSLSTNLFFSSVDGVNLYRIIQEAANNALKYANANNINISINKINNYLHIQISDDGIGFDLETVNEGNGLYNIRKRAEEMNAKLEIKSLLNQGTQVELKLEINTTID